jgi:hypothetical protein
LWALQAHLEAQKEGELDERDRVALGLARRWTGVAQWPETQQGIEPLRRTWRCQRTACVFHAGICAHGEKKAS